jgi:hypothetical protein
MYSTCIGREEFKLHELAKATISAVTSLILKVMGLCYFGPNLYLIGTCNKESLQAYL